MGCGYGFIHFRSFPTILRADFTTKTSDLKLTLKSCPTKTGGIILGRQSQCQVQKAGVQRTVFASSERSSHIVVNFIQYTEVAREMERFVGIRDEQ